MTSSSVKLCRIELLTGLTVSGTAHLKLLFSVFVFEAWSSTSTSTAVQPSTLLERHTTMTV